MTPQRQPEASRQSRDLFFLVLSLLPSLVVLTYGLDLPHLCHLKDDGVYLATAWSISRGGGYRVASLPDNPWNVKYPPLYPLLLSPAFLLGGSLEQSLAIANVLQWLSLPAFALLTLRIARKLTSPAPLVVVLMCISYWGAVEAVHSPLSDLWAAALVIAALLAFDRSALAAGLLASAAYLVRTISVTVMAAIALEYVLQKKFRSVAIFSAVVAVPVLFWTAWSNAHAPPLRDFNDHFMSVYSDEFAHEFPRQNPIRRIGLQLLLISNQVGRMLIPPFIGGDSLNLFRLFLGAGCLLCLGFLPRIFRLYCALSLIVILFWPWTPFARFFVPLLPLVATGVAIAASRVACRFSSPLPSPVAGAWFASMMIVAEYGYVQLIAHYKAQNETLRPAYDWIRRNTPPDARFSAFRDATLFFHTGRRAETLHCSVREEWENPGYSRQRTLALGDWARRRGHRFVLLTPWDYSLSSADYQLLRQNLERHGTAVFSAGEVYIFDLDRPPSARSAAAFEAR